MLLASVVLASNAYAGGEVIQPMQPLNPALFATIEGGYTWNALGSTTVSYTGETSTFTGTVPKKKHGATGRVAAGAIHYSSNPDLSYTAELGWGYYGYTTYKTVLNLINAKNSIYGVDLLLGINYQFNPMFDVFLKLGGLLENVRMTRNTNLNSVGIPVVENVTTTTSSVIPEVKLGGIYNLTNAWGISLAYMHAFGNSPSMSVTKVATTTPVTTNIRSMGSPITLDSVTLGLEYKFA